MGLSSILDAAWHSKDSITGTWKLRSRYYLLFCCCDEYFTISVSKTPQMTSLELITSHGFRSLTTTKKMATKKQNHLKACTPWCPHCPRYTLHKCWLLIISTFVERDKSGSLSDHCHCAIITEDCYKSNEYFRLLPYYVWLCGVWQQNCQHCGYCWWLIQFSTP